MFSYFFKTKAGKPPNNLCSFGGFTAPCRVSPWISTWCGHDGLNKNAEIGNGIVNSLNYLSNLPGVAYQKLPTKLHFHLPLSDGFTGMMDFRYDFYPWDADGANLNDILRVENLCFATRTET